jgi:uncharacterized protein (DUF169 family)
MDTNFRDHFLKLWKKYFNHAELPIALYYSDSDGGAGKANPPKHAHSCIICELAKVRKGDSVWYDTDTVICGGGKRYLGFTDSMRPNFEYFLSYGIPGKMEGERYIKSPELVKELQKDQKKLPITGSKLIIKRWDKLEESDEPQVVVFFATPDVLSGLYTLANFDRKRPDATYLPFGAGCGSIVHYPYLEMLSDNPRAVIGMFDPSARKCVPADTLSFAVPMKRFAEMVNNMEESFLITETWQTVQKRIK